MKTTLKIILPTVYIMLCCSSCGVIFGGSKYIGTVVAKDHPEAKIYVNGKMTGQGTSIGLYPRKNPLTVELREEGCNPKTYTFYSRFRVGSFVLSILNWGILGGLIDVGTGAAYKPDHINNPSIEKVGIKNFIFKVDYEDCPTKVITSNRY